VGRECYHIECARRLILSSTVQPLTDAQVYWSEASLAWSRTRAGVSVLCEFGADWKSLRWGD
jgi:hypothetical protein